MAESGRILNCSVNFNEYNQLENYNRICLQYHGHSDENKKFKKYMNDVYFNDSDKSSKIGVYQKEERGHVYCFDRPSKFTGVLGATSTRGIAATDFFRNLEIKTPAIKYKMRITAYLQTKAKRNEDTKFVR